VLRTDVHQGEKYTELLSSANLPKGRIVVQSTICLNAIICNVVTILQFSSCIELLLIKFLWQQRDSLELVGLVEGRELVLKLGLRQPLDGGGHQLVKLYIHLFTIID
jgi:hypothetical protein